MKYVLIVQQEHILILMNEYVKIVKVDFIVQQEPINIIVIVKIVMF